MNSLERYLATIDGKPVDFLPRLHICGNITHLLPGISSLGVDVLDVDHMVDPATVREAVGTRTAIAGNLDPVAGVMRSDPETIRARVRELYAAAGNPLTPFLPPTGPANGSFNGHHPKSKLLATTHAGLFQNHRVIDNPIQTSITSNP